MREWYGIEVGTITPEQARAALHNFCQRKNRMSVPVRADDDDIVIAAFIDQASAHNSSTLQPTDAELLAEADEGASLAQWLTKPYFYVWENEGWFKVRPRYYDSHIVAAFKERGSADESCVYLNGLFDTLAKLPVKPEVQG